jgi:hypothetical protein
VKAGLVEHPHKWKWSSYNSFIGLQVQNSFLNTQWLSSQFSLNSSKAKEKIVEYTYEDIDCKWNPEDYTYGKIVLGSKEFFHEIIEKYIDTRYLDSKIFARSEFDISKNHDPEFLLEQIKMLNLDEKINCKVTVYYLKQHTNLSLREIGLVVGKSANAVSKIFLRAKNDISTEIREKIKV